MRSFEYVRASSVVEAVEALASVDGSKILAGGTNLVDLMKHDVEHPVRLIDIRNLPLRDIRETAGGGLHLGALATNSEVAFHPLVTQTYPLLAKAILTGASPQLRNVATVGGNLLQRTRCAYFYDVQVACNKRAPGSGCPAMSGLNRNHAILGASKSCIATHPSDMCVALSALGAKIRVVGREGERVIEMDDFHRLPGETPNLETALGHDEIIVGVEIPNLSPGASFEYLKVRDRLSYAFALVSVAAMVRVENGIITEARLAIGSVAHKPWFCTEAESVLIGQPPDRQVFADCATRSLENAVSQTENAFKITLAHRSIVRALETAVSSVPKAY